MRRFRPDMVGFSPTFNDELMDFSDEERGDDDLGFMEAGYFTYPTRQPTHMHRMLSIDHSETKQSKQEETIHIHNEPKPTIDDLTVSSAPEWALCSVCHEIFKRPSITRCGHTFCYACVVEVVSRKGNCPLCRQEINGLLSISTNYQMKQVLSGLLVRCRYGVVLKSSPFSPSHSPFLSSTSSSPASSSLSSSSFSSASSTSSSNVLYIWELDPDGCRETFEFGNRSKHESQCMHAPVTCFNEGCLAKVKRKDIEQHMAECVHGVMKCICGEIIQFQHQEKHAIVCPERIVQCSRKCGASYLLRQQEEHLESCPNVEIPCPHFSFGCKFKAKREEHQSHLSECLYEKLKDYLVQTQDQIRQLVKISHSQQKEITALKTALAAQAAEITSLRGKGSGVQTQQPRSRSSSFRTFLNNPFNDLHS